MYLASVLGVLGYLLVLHESPQSVAHKHTHNNKSLVIVLANGITGPTLVKSRVLLPIESETHLSRNSSLHADKIMSAGIMEYDQMIQHTSLDTCIVTLLLAPPAHSLLQSCQCTCEGDGHDHWGTGL